LTEKESNRQFHLNLCSDILRIDSNCADAIYLRGLCLYQKGEAARALAFLNEALRVDPDNHRSRKLLKVSNPFEICILDPATSVI
jgi:tetratricopeptide (TPR) repeat protein